MRNKRPQKSISNHCLQFNNSSLRLNIPAKARELSAVLLWLSGRENGKILFVLLCFFLVVFFSLYNIDIWLATVSLG